MKYLHTRMTEDSNLSIELTYTFMHINTIVVFVTSINKSLIHFGLLNSNSIHGYCGILMIRKE